MNRFAKAAILSVAAIATIASTVDLAAAGDRYWRRHHAVKPWKKRVVIGGVAAGIVAGAVIASRPRIIYRDDPVIVDEPPFYDDEALYDGDDDTVYADPDVTPRRRVDREPAPEAEDYAAPGFEDDASYPAEQPFAENDDDYFPEKPKARVKRDSVIVERKKESVAMVPARPVKKKETTRKEANVAALQPWSKEWRSWCAEKFPSFNPQNGTYLGYDKKRHFCKAG